MSATAAQDTAQPLAPAPSPRLHPLPHLVRAVWLRALRRRELHVLLILMGLYILGALVMRVIGIDTPQTARFIRGLGLQLAGLLSAILVIVLAGRQVPEELELRTIYPVLARPVTRAQYLLGKAAPTFAAGLAALLLFVVFTLAVTPSLPYQHLAVLAQALALKAAALAMLTALALWLSLRLPSAVAMLAAGAVYFVGAPVANILAEAAGAGLAARWLTGLIPNFPLLGHLQRFVDGGPVLGPAAFAGLVAYAALFTAIFAALALRRFNRMPL